MDTKMTENGSSIGGPGIIRLSLGQILMVATMLTGLAVGWGTLKTEVDSIKEALKEHGASLVNLEAQVTQIRIDMAAERKALLTGKE